LRRRLGGLRLADRPPELAVPGLGYQNLADRPAVDALDGVLNDGGAATLGPYLEGLSRAFHRSEEHTSELQSRSDLVCRLLLEQKKQQLTKTKSQTKNKDE